MRTVPISVWIHFFARSGTGIYPNFFVLLTTIPCGVQEDPGSVAQDPAVCAQLGAGLPGRLVWSAGHLAPAGYHR